MSAEERRQNPRPLVVAEIEGERRGWEPDGEPRSTAVESAPATESSPAMRASQAVSMAVCVAFGFAYFAWVAFTEGWRFWLVASLVATVGVAGFVAHRVMRAGRL